MKAIIKSKIEELLSKEFYCSADELNGKSVVYSVNFNAKKPYIKILAYRNCVVICTSEDLYYKVRELVQSKNRDEILNFRWFMARQYIMFLMITIQKTHQYR